MTLTRLQTDTAEDAINKAMAATDAACEAIATIARRLTVEERKELPRPVHGFETAMRSMVVIAEKDVHILAEAVGFDGEAVLEDLTNAEAIAPLIERLRGLLRLAEDARLAWLAEAYEGAMPLYRLSRVAARDDARLQTVIAPLHALFRERHRGKEKESEPEPTG